VIGFLDESGFMLQPVVRRTWSRRGVTPSLRCWDRRDRLSVIAAILVPPSRERHRLRSAFRVHRRNIRAVQVLAFIKLLRRTARAPLILVMDRCNIHRAAIVRRWVEQQGGMVEIEWLPPYAPDLNPVEAGWSNAKYARLANFVPVDVDHLHTRVGTTLRGHRHRPNLLASFFDHAGLRQC
jgi:transposase